MVGWSWTAWRHHLLQVYALPGVELPKESTDRSVPSWVRPSTLPRRCSLGGSALNGRRPLGKRWGIDRRCRPHSYRLAAGVPLPMFDRRKTRTCWPRRGKDEWETNPQFNIIKLSTLFLTTLAVSVTKIELLASLADILVCAPWRAGKKVEWINAGLT